MDYTINNRPLGAGYDGNGEPKSLVELKTLYISGIEPTTSSLIISGNVTIAGNVSANNLAGGTTLGDLLASINSLDPVSPGSLIVFDPDSAANTATTATITNYSIDFLSANSSTEARTKLELGSLATLNNISTFNLADLGDVGTTTPSNGNVLTYNAGQWNAAAPTGGTGGTGFIVVDVPLGTDPTTGTGTTLTLQSSDNTIIVTGEAANTINFSVCETNFTNIPQTSVVNLTTDLSNRATTSYVNSNFLATSTNFDGLNNVNVGGATIGQIVYFDGSNWINTSPTGAPLYLATTATIGTGGTGFIVVDVPTGTDPTTGTGTTLTLQSSDNKIVITGQSSNTINFSVCETNFTNIPQTSVVNLTTDLSNRATTSYVNSNFLATSTNFDGLNNVDVGGATNGQIVYYNGSNWVNTSPTGAPLYLATADMIGDPENAIWNAYKLQGVLLSDATGALEKWFIPYFDSDDDTWKYKYFKQLGFDTQFALGDLIDVEASSYSGVGVFLPDKSPLVWNGSLSSWEGLNITNFAGELAEDLGSYFVSAGGGGYVSSNYTVSTLKATSLSATTYQNLPSSTLVWGQAEDVVLYVKNKSANTISKGTAVTVVSGTGDIAIVEPLSSVSSHVPEAYGFANHVLGLAKDTILGDSFGYVVVAGVLTGDGGDVFDTSMWDVGDSLYVSSNGQLNNERPLPPYEMHPVGIVLRSHPTVGSMLVMVENAPELNDLVGFNLASSLINGDVIAYESSSYTFKNVQALNLSGVSKFGTVSATTYQNLPTSSHSQLLNLSANDHPQYVLSSTNQSLSSTVSNHISSAVHWDLNTLNTNYINASGDSANASFFFSSVSANLLILSSNVAASAPLQVRFASNATSPHALFASADGTEISRINLRGTGNMFFGKDSGSTITTGIYNTALGFQAHQFASTGQSNTALGYHANYSINTASRNTGIGMYTNSYTTGNDNTSVGYGANYTNASGTFNVAVGSEAAFSASAGSRNVAVGYGALRNNQSGTGNIGIGYRAGQSFSGATAGSNNIAIGHDANQAGQNTYSNTILIGSGVSSTASNETIIGHSSTSATIIRGTLFASSISATTYQNLPTSSLSGLADVLITSTPSQGQSLVWSSTRWVPSSVAGGGASAVGSNNQIQFYNNGSFSATSGFTWDPGDNTIKIQSPIAGLNAYGYIYTDSLGVAGNAGLTLYGGASGDTVLKSGPASSISGTAFITPSLSATTISATTYKNLPVSALSGLSDTQITSPATSSVLKWNGTKWVAAPDATGTGGGGISDAFSFVDINTGTYVLTSTGGDTLYLVNGNAIEIVESTTNTVRVAVVENQITHNNLTGLTTGNPHTQYATLSGSVFTGGVSAASISATTYLNLPSGTAIWNANAIQGVSVTSTSPTTGQVLVYNGANWVPSALPTGGSTSPGGVNTSVQFNNNGSFSGVAEFDYKASSNILEVPNLSATTISATTYHNTWNVIEKLADQNYSSTTAELDTHLRFNMEANTKYSIRASVFFSGFTSTADIRYGFSGPASPTLIRMARHSTAAGATSFAILAVAAAYDVTGAATTTANAGLGALYYNGTIHNGANAGDFVLLFAAAAASQNNAVYAGSYLEYIKQ